MNKNMAMSYLYKQVMNQHTPVAHPDLDAILGADQWARAQAQGCVPSAKG
jgi:1-deoxy-D-xylulose 5-phosphate reductoisomerase